MAPIRKSKCLTASWWTRKTKDIYITDAGNYVTPGALYCFDKYGKKKWVQRSGNIPGHFALVPIYKSDSAQPDPVLQFQ